MNNYKSANTYIRCLYSQGYSSLMLSFLKTNLVFGFTPYIGKDSTGQSQYCREKFLSTSVNYEGASYFYQTAMLIIKETDPKKQITAKLLCNNNTTLILEYKPDEDNQMSAYLVINKNNDTIKFKFKIYQYQEWEEGQVVTKIIQAGLGLFLKVLEAYLIGTGANNHLNKLSEEFLESHEIYEQIP